MKVELEPRRKLITGAAAGAMVAAAALGTRTAQAQLAMAQRAPLNTPIKDMMSPEAAKMLTPAAAMASKADLIALRAGVRGMKTKGPETKLSVTDVDSIEKAFDSSEFAAHSKLGFKLAGTPLGMSTAAAHSVTACCSCCPCCSTAAAMTP